MTPTQFKRARAKLGYTAEEMAKALGLGKHGARTIYRIEKGSLVTGPMELAVQHLLAKGRSPMKSFDQQVADWAAKKDAGERYEYGSYCRCALAQFLVEAGYTDNPNVGATMWGELGKPWERREIPKRLVSALEARPHTFGALAARLRGEA